MAVDVALIKGAPVPAFEIANRYLGSRTVLTPSDTVTERVQAVWKHAARLIQARGGSRIEINFSRLSVSYKKPDGSTGVLGQADLKEHPELLGLMQKVREAAKTIYHEYSSEIGISSNRSLIGPTPLGKLWERNTEKAREQIIQSYKEEDQSRVREVLATTDRFIETLRSRLHRKRITIGMEQAESPEKRREKEDRLRILDRFIQQLEQMDKEAIDWAVSTSDLKEPLEKDRRALIERAYHLSEKIRSVLEADMQGTGRKILYRLRRGCKEQGLERAELARAIRDYALDVGDLMIHDPQAHAERVEAEGREIKRCSMEEFIVYMMMHLRTEGFKLELSSLGMREEEAELLKDCIEEARQAMQPRPGQQTAVAGIPAEPPLPRSEGDRQEAPVVEDEVGARAAAEAAAADRAAAEAAIGAGAREPADEPGRDLPPRIDAVAGRAPAGGVAEGALIPVQRRQYTPMWSSPRTWWHVPAAIFHRMVRPFFRPGAAPRPLTGRARRIAEGPRLPEEAPAGQVALRPTPGQRFASAIGTAAREVLIGAAWTVRLLRAAQTGDPL